jgi:ribosome-binding protein aMBF1 (putative translation factor)
MMMEEFTIDKEEQQVEPPTLIAQDAKAEELTQEEKREAEIWHIAHFEGLKRNLSWLQYTAVYQEAKYLMETDPVQLEKKVVAIMIRKQLEKDEAEEERNRISIMWETQQLKSQTEAKRSVALNDASRFETLVPKVSIEYRTDLIRARTTLFRKQTDFAKALAEKVSVIQDLESGKASQPTGSLKLKIQRYFKKNNVAWEH